MSLTTNQQIIIDSIAALSVKDGELVPVAGDQGVNAKIVEEGGSKSSSVYKGLITKGLIERSGKSVRLTAAGLEHVTAWEPADEPEDVEQPEDEPEDDKPSKPELLDTVPVYDARDQRLDNDLVVIRLVGRSKRQAEEAGLSTKDRRRIAIEVFNSRESDADVEEALGEVSACRFKTLHVAVLERIAAEGERFESRLEAEAEAAAEDFFGSESFQTDHGLPTAAARDAFRHAFMLGATR